MTHESGREPENGLLLFHCVSLRVRYLRVIVRSSCGHSANCVSPRLSSFDYEIRSTCRTRSQSIRKAVVGLVPSALVGELRGMVSAPLTSGSLRSISASPPRDRPLGNRRSNHEASSPLRVLAITSDLSRPRVDSSEGPRGSVRCLI
jgi:hypothetical protein